MFNNYFFAGLAAVASTILIARPADAAPIKFNPDAPIYIEYKTATPPSNTNDISLQIEDAKGPTKIRLSLQPKPESVATYYAYMWLQIGKTITNEANFVRSAAPLYGWLRDQDQLQTLFLFDNEAAVQQFKAEAAAAKKPLVDKKMLPQLAAPAASKAIEVNSELGEVVRFGNLVNAYEAFKPEQKKINDQRAAQLAQSGLAQYRAKNYVAAENQLNESLKLNPSVGINRYYLAICYYQNKKYDRSLALLSLAEGAEYNYAEYRYYTGLNLLKLKKYDQATENLDGAKEENDPDYSAPAAFFNGHIYFQREDYANARKNFEYTVDQSKNPKMDSEAEAMLDRIDAAEGFKNKMNQRFHYTLFAGFGYDSNVVNVSTQNLATDVAAYRAIYGANLNYLFLYGPQHDLSLDLNASDYYSMNSNFKSDATVQANDPQMFGASLPYHYRFQVGPRIYTWGLLPSYQILNMSLQSNQRTKILDSTILGTDLYFAVSEKYFSRISMEYANDHYTIDVTTPQDRSSARKVTLLTTQTFLSDPARKKSWMFDLGYTANNADGENYTYNKIMTALTYSQLGLWNAINSARLDYWNSKYPDALTARTDNVATLTIGLTKDLNKSLALTANGLYTLSQSTQDIYKYNKFALQTLLTFNGAF